ncbi:unnamed protein product [Arctogadus glacialis]
MTSVGSLSKTNVERGRVPRYEVERLKEPLQQGSGPKNNAKGAGGGGWRTGVGMWVGGNGRVEMLDLGSGSHQALRKLPPLNISRSTLVEGYAGRSAALALRAQSGQNTAVGTSVFMVNATDPDQGTGGSVLFYFQPPSPFFAIDGARGIVTVNRTLDYETTSAYQLTINATDQDRWRPLSRLTNLAILITDIQDMNPVFTNLPYSTNIAEDKPPGYEVRKIRAIDQDLGRPRGIGYTIISAVSRFVQ